MTGPEDSLAVALRVAARALAKELGLTRVSLRPETEGLRNNVFRARTRGGEYIVRLSPNAAQAKVYERERDAIAQVKKLGVPVTDTIAIGRSGDWPYMISRRVPGQPALHHPRRLEVIERLGRMAALVHTLRTVGYGYDFDFPNGVEQTTTWADWLADAISAETRLAMLKARGLITSAQAAALQETLAEVKGWDELPVLNHGDLRLKNVLVDSEGEIQGLIDWEDSVSAIGPHWDISVALHDLSIDAKQAFLNGYGLPEEAVRAAAPVWRLFNALNYVPTVEKLEAEGDKTGLEHLKTRLSGALDLYAA